MTEYIIQLEEQESYPFDGSKQHCQEVLVRKVIKVGSKEEQRKIQNNVVVMLSLDHPNLVKIVRVLQRKGRQFELDYEYIGENLFRSARITDGVFLSYVKDKLIALSQYLSQKGIKLDLKNQDMGVTVDGQPKLFMTHSFETVADEKKGQLSQQYQEQIQKLIELYGGNRLSVRAPSEISDYSQRLDKKLTQI